MNMVVLLLDNEIYGLTKMQTSPTTPQGYPSNTQPRGSFLPPLNPLEATLGVTNVSFVAQTADWVPAHLYATLDAAFEHPGFSFVRVLQRCPQYTAPLFEQAVRNPDLTELLVHDSGIVVPELAPIYKKSRSHDPSNLDMARQLAKPDELVRLGLFYKNSELPRYEETRHVSSHTAQQKIALLNEEFDRYAV